MLEPQLNTDMMRFLQLKDAHKKITDDTNMDIEIKYAVLTSMENEMKEIQLSISKFIKTLDNYLENGPVN